VTGCAWPGICAQARQEPDRRRRGLTTCSFSQPAATLLAPVPALLEEQGLAQRLRADGLTREQALVLTAAGKALVPKLAALADANDEHFFSHLRAEERQSLMDAMQALVKHHQLKDIPTA
jgi:hypothetical protein